MLVEDFLSVLRRLAVVKPYLVFPGFCRVESMAVIGDSFVDVVGHIQSGFVEQPVPSFLVEFRTQKLKLCSNFFGFFASKLDFKTWFEKREIAWNLEV